MPDKKWLEEQTTMTLCNIVDDIDRGYETMHFHRCSWPAFKMLRDEASEIIEDRIGLRFTTYKYVRPEKQQRGMLNNHELAISWDKENLGVDPQ